MTLLEVLGLIIILCLCSIASMVFVTLVWIGGLDSVLAKMITDRWRKPKDKDRPKSGPQ